jgi:branched-chain amino acid transport system substrate-binding protein
MRRRLGWAAVIAGLSLITTGCSAGESDAELEGEIPIGVTIEKTGPAEILGDGELKALNLVADQVNVKGVLGKRIKLVITDNGSNGAKAAEQVTSLIQNDRVVGIVGPGTSAAAQPVLEVVEKAKVPMVTMGSADALVQGRKFVFKTPPNGREMVAVLLRELKTISAKRVGMLAVRNSYGDNGLAAVSQAMKSHGIPIVATERFDEADKDLTAQMTRLVNAGPDVILVSAIMPGAGYAAAAVKKLGYQGRVFFDAGAGAEVFIASAKEASENMYMIHHSILAADHTTATTPSMLAQKEFFSAYTRRYGHYSGYASYAADALNIMVEAIRKAGSTDPQRIRDALESLQYDGLSGTFDFSPDNHGGASGDGLTVLTVQNRAWVLAP